MEHGNLVSQGRSTAADAVTLTSEVVPLAFTWNLVENRPGLRVQRTMGPAAEWYI